MDLLIDSNVVLDVILNREPFFELSEKVLSLGLNDNINAYISAASVTDIYYRESGVKAPCFSCGDETAHFS